MAKGIDTKKGETLGTFYNLSISLDEHIDLNLGRWKPKGITWAYVRKEAPLG